MIIDGITTQPKLVDLFPSSAAGALIKGLFTLRTYIFFCSCFVDLLFMAPWHLSRLVLGCHIFTHPSARCGVTLPSCVASFSP